MADASSSSPVAPAAEVPVVARLDDVKDSPEDVPVENEEKSKKSLLERIKDALTPDSVEGEHSDDDGEEKLPPVSIRELFSYADRTELSLILLSTIAALVHGTTLPLFTVIFGSVIDALSTTSTDEIVDAIGGVAKWFLILGGAAFVVSIIQVRSALIFGQRVSHRLRTLYFLSLMRQDYSWYDSVDSGQLVARVAADVSLVEAGIGDKLMSGVQFISQFLTGIIIAFIYGWKLTFIILSAAPFLAISGALFSKLAADGTNATQGAYAAAGGIASEVISLIRIVTAYNGQEEEAVRYEKKLDDAYRSHVRKAAFGGVALGFTYFVIFCTFAIAFAFGAAELRRGVGEPGDIIVTFFSVFIATLSIGQAAPALNSLSIARGAAPRVFEIIRRNSDIDPLDENEGEVIESLQGTITFKDVNFNYPTRQVQSTDEHSRPYVLSNCNISFPAGTNHALVGPSGCGKSTTVRLIERFYDVDDGAVLLDGVDIRKLNVRWLRSQIGYVGQMPTLFMLSVRENIALGAAVERVLDKETGKYVLKRKEVTDEEIIDAAKKANAHGFIQKLPERYNTMLGERGALLSGGQKQRICIARALIRNPKVLLLDESTSALDARAEKHVQDALEKASAGRTTITIAHRLSTVKNADIISVIDNGQVREAGIHTELMAKKGRYFTLVENQNVEAQVGQSEKKGAGDATDDDIVIQADNDTEKDPSRVHVEDRKEGEDDAPAVDKGVYKRAFAMNSGEIIFILIGMIGAAGAGAAFPAMAIAFATVITSLSEDNTPGTIARWCWMFVGIGAGAFVCYILNFLMLGISGGRLTRKVRALAFRTILRQEMGFFDKPENSVGNLTTRLATESTLVQGITGDTLGSISLVLGTLLTGFIVSYVSCWRIALVVTGIFPLMGVSEAAQAKLVTGFDSDSAKKFASAGAVAAEAVDNIDTVNSTGVQDYFIDKYNKELEIPLVNGRKRALVAGITFGIAEFLAQALWAISFWVGSIFVKSGDCSFQALLKGISGLLFAGSALGQAAMFTPDIGKSRVAATSIFRLLDRVPEIDPTNTDGKVQPSSAISGDVSAEDVVFEYPSRPDVPVLRGLSTQVSPGQTLALVGESGCGKSTMVALLERFYDPRSGAIKLDDADVRSYQVCNLRSHMGIVSQEPDLFNRSVRDNIAYGLAKDNATPVTDSMIEDAARTASAHEFIQELPDGYDTIVGIRGSRLSGGQRQRVAIARSLVRDPRVLLLDEATSALDAVSEQLVQTSLDKAAQGRTTIAIAHRLSTIKDADVIGVVRDGKIAESGKHADLLQKNGIYAALVKNQVTEVP